MPENGVASSRPEFPDHDNLRQLWEFVAFEQCRRFLRFNNEPEAFEDGDIARLTHGVQRHGGAAALSSDALEPVNDGRGHTTPASGRIDTQAKKPEPRVRNPVSHHADHPPIDLGNQAPQIRCERRSLTQRRIRWPVHLPQIVDGEAIDLGGAPRICRSQLADR
jgi:hypothetical protein